MISKAKFKEIFSYERLIFDNHVKIIKKFCYLHDCPNSNLSLLVNYSWCEVKYRHNDKSNQNILITLNLFLLPKVKL